MSRRKRRRKFSKEIKEKEAKRLVKGESPTALSQELKVLRKDLYRWKSLYQNGRSLASRPGPKFPTAVEAGHNAWEAWKRVADLWPNSVSNI